MAFFAEIDLLKLQMSLQEHGNGHGLCRLFYLKICPKVVYHALIGKLSLTVFIKKRFSEEYYRSL